MGGDINAGSQVLELSIDEVAQSKRTFRGSTSLIQLLEILVQTRHMADGLAVIERMEQSGTSCYTPELLRLKGELSLLQDTPAAAETAKDLFRRALDEAHRQGALAWELRAATSLGRLLRDQGRPADATACLQPIYDRFTEGFGTTDLIAAKQLLDDLVAAGHR